MRIRVSAFYKSINSNDRVIQQNELSLDERTAGVPALLTKVAKYRPRILCFIGLGIAKIVQAELKLSTVRTTCASNAGKLC